MNVIIEVIIRMVIDWLAVSLVSVVIMIPTGFADKLMKWYKKKLNELDE